MTNPDPASAVASAAIAAAAAGPLSKLVKIVIIVMIIYFPPDLNPSNHDHYLKIIKTQCEWSSRSRSLWSGILFSRTLIFVCRLFTSPPPPSSSTSSHHIKVTERSIWPGVSSLYDINVNHNVLFTHVTEIKYTYLLLSSSSSPSPKASSQVGGCPTGWTSSTTASLLRTTYCYRSHLTFLSSPPPAPTVQHHQQHHELHLQFDYSEPHHHLVHPPCN